MTQTGMMIGTMEYMSPEQAMGKELDARSDHFAVGLIFYELLTGNMPFHAESAIASLVKRTQERAVPLADIDTRFPRRLSASSANVWSAIPTTRFAHGAGHDPTNLKSGKARSRAAVLQFLC